MGLEAHLQSNIFKFGGGSLMMWGCMTAQGFGVYTSILDDYLLPTIKYYKLNRDRVIFQQDNDSKHTSRAAQEWFDENQIKILVWPPRSPDLSLIEHLWQYLKIRLDTYDTEPKGTLELWERTEIECNKILRDVCIGLIENMSKCIAAVLKAKGGYTKY